MKKVLACVLAVTMILMAPVSALSLTAVESSAKPIMQESPQDTGGISTLSGTSFKPGLNQITYTLEPETFDTEKWSDGKWLTSFNGNGITTGAGFDGWNLTTDLPELTGGDGKALHFYRAGAGESYPQFYLTANMIQGRKYYVSLRTCDVGASDRNMWIMKDNDVLARLTDDYRVAMNGGKWFTYTNKAFEWSKSTTSQFKIQVKKHANDKRVDGYFDDLMIMPYYQVTYMNTDGTTVYSAEQFLFDADGKVATTYAPKTDNYPLTGGGAGAICVGWSTDPDAEDPMTVVELQNSDFVLYPVWKVILSEPTAVGVHQTNISNIANNIVSDLNSMLAKIPICDTTVYGPSVSILGRDFYPLKFDAKAVLDLAGLSKSITIDEDKKTVHVILGKKNTNGQASVVQTTKMCDASWSKQYKEIKDLYKTMTGFDMKGSSGGVNNWNRFEKMKAELNHLKCDFIISADMSVLGYIDFDYQTGSLKFSEGGIIETASLGVELKRGSILYVSLGLKGSEEGTIKATVSSTGYIEPYMSLKPTLTATAKIGGNIGIAKIEGGIDATLAFLLQTSDPKLQISMNGKLFVTGSVVNHTILDEKYQYLNCELYPEFKNNNTKSSSSAYSYRLAPGNVFSTEDTLNIQPMDRSYLYATSLVSMTDENTIYTLHSVYPQNNAQLIRLSGDSMMLVWTGDDGAKSDINRSSLMYSIYKNGVWSDIKVINEDGTATGDFRAVTDGISVYLVYQKYNNVLDDNTLLYDSLEEIDLYYTQYQDEEFSAPVRITNNNKLFEVIGDVSVTKSGLEVVWVENSENDIMLSSGTNTVKAYVAGDSISSVAELSASDTEYISNVCIGDDSVYYTIANSTDNSTVMYKYDNTMSKIMENDSDISNLKTFDGKLYYIKNTGVYSFDGDSESETGIDGISDFELVTNGNDKAMLMSVFDGKGCELYISRFENESWSQKDRFTDLNKYIRSYSPFMYSDGTINAAVSAADVNDGESEETSIYGNTSIMVLNQCDYFDVATSYMYYEGDIASNKKIDLYFDVTNNSSSEIRNINVRLNDENGNELESHTISCSIAPYATEVLSVPYTLPNKIKLSVINAEISADKAEKNYENNKVSVSYGYANVKVLPVSYAIQSDNTAKINTTITNDGFTDAENVVVRVYNGSKNGDILEEKNIGILNVGGSYNLDYTFPKDLMVSSEEDVMNAVYVVVTTSSDESMYSDNEEKATFDSSICKIDDIAIDGTNIQVRFTKNFDKKAVLVAASYTEDNRLHSVTYTTVNLTDSMNFVLDTEGASYISVFLWDDMNSLTPICNKFRKNI